MAMPEGWTNEDFLSWVSRGGDVSNLGVSPSPNAAAPAPMDLNAVRQQINGFTSEDQLNNFLRTTSLSPEQLAQAFPQYSVADISNRIAVARTPGSLSGAGGQGQIGTYNPQAVRQQISGFTSEDQLNNFLRTTNLTPAQLAQAFPEYSVTDLTNRLSSARQNGSSPTANGQGAGQFTDKQLRDIALYYDTYASDPGKVLEAMKQYGVDAGTLSRAVQQYGRGYNDPTSVQDYVARWGTMIYGDPSFGGNSSQRRDIYSQQRSEAQQREQQRIALLTQAGFLDASGKPTPAAMRQSAPQPISQPSPQQQFPNYNVTQGMFGSMGGMNPYGYGNMGGYGMNPYQMGGYGGMGMGGYGGGFPGMGGGYPGMFGGGYGGMGGFGGGYSPFSSMLQPFGMRGFGNYGYSPMAGFGMGYPGMLSRGGMRTNMPIGSGGGGFDRLPYFADTGMGFSPQSGGGLDRTMPITPTETFGQPMKPVVGGDGNAFSPPGGAGWMELNGLV